MFPSSTLFHYPILKLLSDKKIHSRNEAIEVTIAYLHISKEDCEIKTPGKGGKPGSSKVWSWNNYAFSDLKNAGFLEHSGTGYIITDSGLDFYQSHKDGFVASDLKESEAYRKYKRIGEFKRGSTSTSQTNDQPNTTPIPEQVVQVEDDSTPTKSPIEILEELSAHINESLEESLLSSLKKISPEAFEKLIQRLLIKMDISKSDECIELTQYVKDDGVDIYVYDNVLKMNVVCCIQIKRYTDIAVGLSTVKELVGTLVDKNCKSGMVITTSQFTKGALDFNPNGYNLRKIDGKKLTQLLIQYGIGVKTMRIEVKTIDSDFLSSL